MNDFLAAGVKKNPKRFAGFATLPTAAPDKAAAELESRMKSGGFVGAVINGHNRGRYLDDKFFWPILEAAEALNAPIHIHPTRPPQPVVDAYYSGFSPLLVDMFANPGWGWHIETAVHVIRVVLGGTFDRFPKLQLVIGHLGEGLMSMFQRLDNMTPAMTKLKKPVTSYLRENVHYTFSGFNFPATFLDLLLEVGVDRIMFSADHPYQSMVQAKAFLEQIPVSAADRERIAHGNAESFLGCSSMGFAALYPSYKNKIGKYRHANDHARRAFHHAEISRRPRPQAERTGREGRRPAGQSVRAAG